MASYYAARSWGIHALGFSAAIYFSLFVYLLVYLYFSLHTSTFTAVSGLYGWDRLTLTLGIQDSDGTIDMDKIEQFFGEIDTDRDGFISLDELRQFLNKKAGGKRFNAKAMFEIADRDKKKIMSFQDWRDVICKDI